MSRIYQYPVVTEIGSDDYLALGSTTNGSRSILASDLAPVIGSKTITERGTYKASDDNMDGYGQVTVDIPYTDIHVASGDIATFEGEDLPLKSLKVTVTPYQDLHGYDGPWAGGAGKNKLPLTVESIKTASDKSTWNNNSITINGVTYEIQVDTDGNVSGIKTNGTASGDSNLRIYDDEAEFHGKLLNGCPSNGSINTYYLQLSNVSTGSDFDLGNGTVINQTDTGRWILIINIKNGTTVSNLVFKPMIRLSSVADTTFEPYSNICPIIGWDEAVVSVTGINIWDEEWEVGGISTSSGRDISLNAIRSKGYSPCKPSTAYYTRFTNDGYVFWYDADKNYISSSYSEASMRVVQSPSNANYFRIRKDGITTYNNDISINYPSTDTSYHAYNGATYTIDLDGTRYGGTLDATNGTLTVDWVGVDLSSLSWNSLDYYRYQTTINDMKTKDIRSMDIVCSCYKTNVGGSAYDDGTIYNASSPNRIIIVTSLYSNITDFQNSLSGQTAVYELATPITVQLAPTPVKSLEGVNNINANCGQITEVKYFKKA